MVCSKCGFAVPKGQTNCVYCGTHVSYEQAQSDSSSARRSTSAFAKQLKNSPFESASGNTSGAGMTDSQQAVQKPGNTASAQKPAPSLSSQQPASSPFASASNTANAPFAPWATGASSSAQKIVAPYARRPMYAAFDPNSDDSPFVRKPLNAQPDNEADTKPVQTGSLIVEDKKPEVSQPSEKVSADNTVTAAAVEDNPKKKLNISVAALTAVFVALVICWFINF